MSVETEYSATHGHIDNDAVACKQRVRGGIAGSYKTLARCILMLSLITLTSACANFFGKSTKPGTYVAITSNNNQRIPYQIFVYADQELSEKDKVSIAFNSNQPVLYTSNQEFYFTLGKYILRSRCGKTYQDQITTFTKNSSPQKVLINCQ